MQRVVHGEGLLDERRDERHPELDPQIVSAEAWMIEQVVFKAGKVSLLVLEDHPDDQEECRDAHQDV